MIRAGQRWRAVGAPADVIGIVRGVGDDTWLIRTELGELREMSSEYIVDSFRLLSVGEVKLIDD